MLKLSLGLQVIKHFRNWPKYFLDHFNLIKSEFITYNLRNGIKYSVRSGTVERWMINENWVHKIYTPEDFKIKRNDIVLDIGAQIGVFSVFASQLAKNGKVFSFEPVPENFELLKKNIRLNLISNITPINKAVSNKNGQENIFLSEDTACHSFFTNFSKVHRKIPVETISLNSFIKENKISRIDFLKMDCEGAEYKILFNSPKNVLKKIKKIGMEYHNIDDKNNVSILKEFLEENGFKVTIENGNQGILYATR